MNRDGVVHAVERWLRAGAEDGTAWESVAAGFGGFGGFLSESPHAPDNHKSEALLEFDDACRGGDWRLAGAIAAYLFEYVSRWPDDVDYKARELALWAERYRLTWSIAHSSHDPVFTRALEHAD